MKIFGVQRMEQRWCSGRRWTKRVARMCFKVSARRRNGRDSTTYLHSGVHLLANIAIYRSNYIFNVYTHTHTQTQTHTHTRMHILVERGQSQTAPQNDKGRSSATMILAQFFLEGRTAPWWKEGTVGKLVVVAAMASLPADFHITRASFAHRRAGC